jgi:alginate O-acetyltransferase complex protein AlgI
MLFNSIEFAIFFPIVTGLFFTLPHRFRWILLLVASCYFYMAFIPKYILILLLTILVDYVAGLLISRSSGKRRQLWLILSIVTNVGILAFFKYFNFLNDNIRAIADSLSLHDPIPALSIILPIGLSFHTFQSMSYTIEVYRGHQDAERHLGRFALYVLFYPQLVAGPIERPQNLLVQFRTEKKFDYVRMREGLLLMGWGLFKKVAVADRLASGVNLVYQNSEAYSGAAALLATYAFAIQIYCDFSGYSDIAIGAARVMGFDLMKNFRQPYFSGSISEFWKRWHISLSTWFRDYVYLPLGGSRVSRSRQCLNLLTVFSISGLWHGANWTYVLWGALNGLYLVSSLLTVRLRHAALRLTGLGEFPWVHKAFAIFCTFHLILLSWVFFRADSVRSAANILLRIGTQQGGLAFPESLGGISLVILVLLVAELIQSRVNVVKTVTDSPRVLRWAFYVAAMSALIMFGRFQVEQPFIYFQF